MSLGWFFEVVFLAMGAKIALIPTETVQYDTSSAGAKLDSVNYTTTHAAHLIKNYSYSDTGYIDKS